MIDDVHACFICGAETGTCLHLEPELRPFLATQRRSQAIQFGRLVDSVEEALKREYVARVVRHRRYSRTGVGQVRGLADAAGTYPAPRGADRNGNRPLSSATQHGSRSNARKAASAMIAKIPYALSEYVARVHLPEQ